ncbi:hypothetical protein MRB53_025646 [Persea americana]|uniref:Uncharacterized protein n=1 Tax=Persea americana TaxID=3435 RepID=A0ACC2LFR8_PERAE|nr:hypothetical protein MRB53_025646 [Persea americana]
MEGRGRINGRGHGRGHGGNAPDVTQLAEIVQHLSKSVNCLLQEHDHQRHGRRRNGSDESSYSGNSYNWSDSDSGSSSKSARRHHYRRQSDAGIKVNLPKFSGNLSPGEFLDWLSATEKFFEWKDLSDSKRVKLVPTRLRGLASTWWDQVQEARMRKEKEKIRSWSKSNMRTPSHLKESSTSNGIAGTVKNYKGRDVGPSQHSQEKFNKQAGARCFKCNEIGHRIAKCPLKQRQVHMVEVEAETEDEEDAK